MTKTIYVKVKLTLESENTITNNDIIDVLNDVSYDFNYDNGMVSVVESNDLELINE